MSIFSRFLITKDVDSKYFSGTMFKQHKNEILTVKTRETFPKLFCFLPSTADRKEEINQHISNVNLRTTDGPYDNFQNLSPSNTLFVPSDLELGGETRKAAHEIVDSFLKKATEISNANFIRNAN